MEKVNAIWEKENLGVDCIEIKFSMKDSLETFHSEILTLEESYQVLKIPSGRVEILLEAQKYGFKVIENSIQLKRNLKDYELPGIFKRFNLNLLIREGSLQETKEILSEVKKGEIFKTDRIYVDPKFTNEDSGIRYFNWINKLLENGSVMNVIEFKNNIIGFTVNRKVEGTLFDATFGGLLNSESYSGMGFSTIHANIVSIIKQKGTHISTTVSSNNLAILKLHLLFDFNIVGFDYVLVKHK